MKVKVIVPFKDKYNYSVQYNVGEVHSFEDARALDMIERGLVVSEEEPLKEEVIQQELPLDGNEKESEEKKSEEEVGSEESCETQQDEEDSLEKPRRGRKPAAEKE